MRLIIKLRYLHHALFLNVSMLNPVKFAVQLPHPVSFVSFEGRGGTLLLVEGYGMHFGSKPIILIITESVHNSNTWNITKVYY